MRWAILAAWMLSPAPVLQAVEPVTTGSLVGEMIDLARLADLPRPYFQTVQFSSYDRTSDLPGGPGWFANSDGFGREPRPNFQAVLREPGPDGVGEYLVADVQGPGAIVRVWSAAAEGTVRMYLDGGDEPVYDGPARDFFSWPHRRWAGQAGVDPAVLEGTFQQRDACYLPVPFARGCRIVWIGPIERVHFYAVQIRRYEPGTAVETFTPADLKRYEPEIRRVAAVLRDPAGRWTYASTGPGLPIEATVPAGGSAEVLRIDGPGAIERLTLTVSAADRDAALRQTVMRIVCDDYPWGQVQSPVGDFFGAAPGINPFNSVPFTVAADGTMTCRYVMPFASSLSLAIDNLGDQEVRLTGEALRMDRPWDPQRSMHLRARWRVNHDLVGDTWPWVQDMPFLLGWGEGVYVGTALMLLNPNEVPWPGGNWWGEGDEKVFVDDDVLPSTFGTGSEDYFNYSWSAPDLFGYAYCGQPRNDGPANRGFVTNHRWHVLDCLPFRKRMGFYMELFTHERTAGMSYARIGYHYARPGLIDDHLPITRADVRRPELPERFMPAARHGGSGYTFHQVEDLLGERAGTTLRDGRLWAGGRVLVWRPARRGDELRLKLPVAEAGRQMMFLTVMKSPASGRFSLRLDGQPLKGGDVGDVVDLATPHHTLSWNIRLPEVERPAGEHALTLRCEGGPDGAETGEIGLDFLWIKPAK